MYRSLRLCCSDIEFEAETKGPTLVGVWDGLRVLECPPGLDVLGWIFLGEGDGVGTWVCFTEVILKLSSRAIMNMWKNYIIQSQISKKNE